MASKKTFENESGLSRRTLFGAGAGVAAVAVLPAQAVAATGSWKPKFLSPEQGEALMVLCDLILPKTGTPSATEAGVHEYIDEALSVADADEQLAFLGGLGWLESRAQERFEEGLVSLSEEQQIELLHEISDAEPRRGAFKTGAAFFDDLKGRTLFGYYTSKTGRQVLGRPEKVQREKLVGCEHGAGGHGNSG